MWRQWGDSGSVFLWQNSPVLNNRLQMSPPPAVIFLHQSAQWQRANQSHYTGREREGKQSKERDRQEIRENSHQSDVTKTKGVFHRWRCQAYMSEGVPQWEKTCVICAVICCYYSGHAFPQYVTVIENKSHGSQYIFLTKHHIAN